MFLKISDTALMFWLVVVFVLLIAGCNGIGGDNSSGALQQCPNGGSVVVVGDNPITVCNGSTGATGPSGQNGQNGQGFTPGVSCDIYSIQPSTYSGTVNWATMFSSATGEFSVVLPNFNTPNQSYQTPFQGFTSTQQNSFNGVNFGLDCEGYIDVPVSGNYVFQLGSDDGSELAIDNTVIINMPKAQAFTSSNSNSLYLFAGFHKINVLYFQGPATNEGLQLSWQGPVSAGLGAMTLMPSSVFSH